MTDPAEDRALEEYLRRKSALSMGYKRLYVEETPPPELDRAIAARARRALRWLVPGALAVAIAALLVVGLQFGVNKWMRAMVAAERNVSKIKQERQEQAERERLAQPVSVMIDARDLSRQTDATPAAALPTREAWLAKIAALERAGESAEAEAERRRFDAAYPEAAAR